ncbi:hypothetical protein L7F22_048149 [Adiantum nelumboides]|nr:hypothetical protein [Adiantum nelumboides]
MALSPFRKRKYTREVLAKYNMLNCNPSVIPMSVSQQLTLDMCPSTPAEQHAMAEVPYRPSLGSVRYLVTCTRPDVCLAAGVHSRFMHNPGNVHWQSNKRMVKYLNHTNDFGITYHASLNKDAPRLIGWSDSDWGGDQDTRYSTSGFVFVLAGGAISWQSRKQATVALSSTEAEYVAAAMAAKEGIWLQRLLEELQIFKPLPITLHLDNQSCIHLAKNPKHHEKTKHVDFKYHFIRELVEEGKINLEYTPTEYMWADFLTKAVPKVKHDACCSNLPIQPVFHPTEGGV